MAGSVTSIGWTFLFTRPALIGDEWLYLQTIGEPTEFAQPLRPGQRLWLKNHSLGAAWEDARVLEVTEGAVRVPPVTRHHCKGASAIQLVAVTL